MNCFQPNSVVLAVVGGMLTSPFVCHDKRGWGGRVESLEELPGFIWKKRLRLQPYPHFFLGVSSIACNGIYF